MGFLLYRLIFNSVLSLDAHRSPLSWDSTLRSLGIPLAVTPFAVTLGVIALFLLVSVALRPTMTSQNCEILVPCPAGNCRVFLEKCKTVFGRKGSRDFF